MIFPRDKTNTIPLEYSRVKCYNGNYISRNVVKKYQHLGDRFNSSAGPGKLPSGFERAKWFDPATNKTENNKELNPSTIADR